MGLITPRDVLLLMAASMFLLGFATFMIGVLLLVGRAWGQDVRTLTAQTARLVQKGLAEDVAGLVGNASTLLSTLNELVRTATGIGTFLTIIGLSLMGLTFLLVLQVR
jgi:hypothetical protein